MTDRDQVIAVFVDAAGWGAAQRVPLAGDASFRRYQRLSEGERRAVLMDAPPPQEDVRPFARLARHLGSLGFSVPAILAEDAGAGLLLIEDLGDDTYTRRLADGGDEAALYALAVDVLIDLHRRPASEVIPDGLPAYDDTLLLAEAHLLTDWYAPAMAGRPLADAQRQAYTDAWLSVFPLVHAQPPTLVLKDYHVDNLMWLPERAGIAACGLLDFQDAVAGPAAYDLVSLLEDARRDIDAGLARDMLARYHAGVPGLRREDFQAVYAILGAQRHAKVIGIFTRLCRRDGKPDYLVHIPRVWRLLEAALGHPALAPVRTWFDDNLGTDMRRTPPWEKAPG